MRQNRALASPTPSHGRRTRGHMPLRQRQHQGPSRPAELSTRLHAPLILVSTLALLVAAVFGSVWLAAIALGIALLADLAEVRLQPPPARALDRAGFRRPVRAM